MFSNRTEHADIGLTWFDNLTSFQKQLHCFGVSFCLSNEIVPGSFQCSVTSANSQGLGLGKKWIFFCYFFCFFMFIFLPFYILSDVFKYFSQWQFHSSSQMGIRIWFWRALIIFFTICRNCFTFLHYNVKKPRGWVWIF